MELNDIQLDKVEQLAGCNYSPEKIALYLGVDIDKFLFDWNTDGSPIKYHYERGIVLVQAESDMKLSESAKSGNVTAYQQVLKTKLYQSVENLKKKQQLETAVSDIDKLQRFIEKGDSTGLTTIQEQQYEMLDFARKLYEGYNSRNYVINCLIKSFPEKIKSRKHALLIFNDSMNFFNLNNEVKKEAWCHHYADKFEQAAEIAFSMNDLDTYGKLLKEAKDCRLQAVENNDFPDEIYRKPFVLYTIDPSVFKIKRENRRQVSEWIDKLDVSEDDRSRLHRDSLSEDVEYDMIPSPDAEN